MKTEKIQGLLIGQTIVALISAILLLVTDFAGWYYGNYYAGYQEYGYIYFGSGFLSTILIGLAAAGLGMTAYYSIQMLRADTVETKSAKKQISKMIIAGKISAAIALVGGAVFAISSLIDGTEEWWFDAGFYAALIGGIFVLTIGKILIDKIKK